MVTEFDPYHIWLGIPPEDQPPDYYCLLGVRRFEPNSEVIANLADQRMAHVLTFQAGPHGRESQWLLDDIAAARLCLLNPEKRRQYDARLRSQSSVPQTPAAVQPASIPIAAPYVPAASVVAPSPFDSTPIGPAWPATDQSFAGVSTSGSWPGNSSFDFNPEEVAEPSRKSKPRRKRVVSPGVTIFMQLLGIPTAIGLFLLIQKFAPQLTGALAPDLPATVSSTELPEESTPKGSTNSDLTVSDRAKSSKKDALREGPNRKRQTGER